MLAAAPYNNVVGLPYLGAVTPSVLRVSAAGLTETAKVNLSSATDPGVNNDSSSGYAVGSTWHNTTAGRVWTCNGAAVGAANWVLSGGGAGFGNPAGSGTEVQYRVNATTFGAVAGSAWNGTTLTLPMVALPASVSTSTPLIIGNTTGRGIISQLGVATEPSNQASIYVCHTNGYGIAIFDKVYDATTDGPGLILRRARGTAAVPVDVVDGDQIGYLDMRCFSGSKYFQCVSIDSRVDGAFVSGQAPPTMMRFATNASNGASTERMRIRSNGYVGINTNNLPSVGYPTHLLHVYSAAGACVAFEITSATTTLGGINGISLANLSATTNNWVGLIFGDSYGCNEGACGSIAMQLTDRLNHYGDFAIATRSSGGYSEKLRVTSAGYVGIGETTPISLLHLKNAIPMIRLEDTVDGSVGFIGNANDLVSGTAGRMAIRAENGLYVSGGGNAQHVYVSSVGLVGIGVVSVAAKLHVKIPDQSTAPFLVESSDGADILRLDKFATTDRAQLLVGTYNGEAAPCYSFVADTNTGLSGGFVGDTLHLVTGGSFRITIDPNGHAILNTYGAWHYGRDSAAILRPLIRSKGMGYNEATYPGLQIGDTTSHIALFIDPGTIAGGTFNGNLPELALPNSTYVLQANAGGTDWMGPVMTLINGNIGIGVAAPVCRFHVEDTVNGLLAYFRNLGSGSGWVGLDRAYNMRANAIRWSLSGTAEWFAGTLYKSGVASLNFYISAGTENVSASLTGLCITTSGDVGINAFPSGSYRLQVDGKIYATDFIQSVGSVIGNNGQFNNIYPANDLDLTIQTRATTTRNIIFNSIGVTPTETMRLTSAGNVGVGTGATVSAKLHVIATTEQLRLGYDAAKYTTFTTDINGYLTLTPSHGRAYFTFTAAGTASSLNITNLTSNATGVRNTLVMPVYNGASGLTVSVIANSIDTDPFSTHIFTGQSGSHLLFSASNVGHSGTIHMRLDYLGNLGVGTGATLPSAKLHVIATTEQLRLGYDATFYTSFTVDSAGDLTISPSGGDVILPVTARLNIGGLVSSGNCLGMSRTSAATGEKTLYVYTSSTHNGLYGIYNYFAQANSSGSQDALGMSNYVTTAMTGTGTVSTIATYFAYFVQASANTVNTVRNFRSLAQCDAAKGTVSLVQGFNSISTVAAGTTLTELQHYSVSESSGGGTIGTQYGVKIENLTYAGTNWSIYTGTAASYFGGDVQIADAKNLVLNTTTGTKIGTATNQKLGFWNATPVVQQTTGVAAATVVQNSGNAVNDATTFDGYTLAQLAKIIRTLGLAA
jgi:hypothetical protein